MAAERVAFTPDKLCHWAGMGDFELVSPDGQHTMALTYEGEPPHGDSYHRACIDGIALPFHVWGRLFTYSACSRYLVFSAMPARWERVTVVVDLAQRRYCALPVVISECLMDWPAVIGTGTCAGQHYVFTGHEPWQVY